MEHFLMWIVSFFMVAIFIFWRYIRFIWFTRKDKDFLQVQREHSQRLCNDILFLEKYLKAMEASSKAIVLNRNQCIHLFGKLIFAMKGINKMLSSATQDLKFQSIFEEFCYLQKRVKIVGKNCSEQERWCELAVFQLQNKETFRDLLLDLKCCYDTARNIYLFHHPNESSNILSIQFDAATYGQVLEDGQALKKKLELVLHGEISKDYELAQHLLLRLRNLDRVVGGDLDALEVPINFKPPKLIKKIGDYVDMYKANWLGLECATKVLNMGVEYLKHSQIEAGILAGLSHPNLVQFFGCGITKRIGEIPEEDEIGEMHLVMELMDSNLSTILRKAKRPLPYLVALDIMHQIAKGVHYLHDMQVAHLDLNPKNILYSSIPMEDLDPCSICKVTNYGTSQLEVCSNSKHLKPSQYSIGTLRYMAPEMMKESKTSQYPFQADVWSFAMICSEILSGKIPYFDLKPRELYNQMKGTHGPNSRPALPKDFKGLTSLIQECWFQNPIQRPTFSKICERLTLLKESFLKGGSYDLEDIKAIANFVPRVDKRIAPPKNIPIDLNHQLSKAKRLLKMSYIGIVGMGGIGKTTLAKAIFDDEAVTSSYHTSCFVAECKNYQNSYEILCKMLSDLGTIQKPKNLKNAQKMMKKIFVKKKVLIVLDDIKDKSQILDLVPPDIVQTSKGTTIIITTRQWSTIRSFVGMEGRLDVELLDEKAATTIFTSHLCWDVASMSPDFVALCKYIVRACNGLPLSLKVMGAFLRNKKLLRSWEQALHRMARGRNLDGDEEIWNTLQISFDGLNDGIEKRMFLDVACFFCRDVYPSGISKATILSMWSKGGILPVDEFERLIDMSLLKVNGDGDILEMHDQLRDMGRMIAKDTRIWKASMIPESGFSSKDVEVLEGISLQGTTVNHMPLLKQDLSFDFEKLRVLILVSSLDNLQAHINNLILLLEIATKCSQLDAIIIGNSQNLIGLPHTFLANTIASLRTKISNLFVTHASLKILDLKGIDFLQQLPHKFASSNSLLELSLSFCLNLVALPKEVGNFSLLITLDLNGCSNLVALPKEVGNLFSLTTLNLRQCSSLAILPKQVGNLSSLTFLDLSGCSSLKTLPKEVGDLSSLSTLYLEDCSSLMALPKEVGNLFSLTNLCLSFCSSLLTLPKEVGNLSSLTTLDLSGCSRLVALPNEVGSMSSLTTFDLSGCSNLVALPKEVGNLSSLSTFNVEDCSSLADLPKEIGNLFSLTTFYLSFCSSLLALPKEVGNLSSLITLYLSFCSNLVVLPKEVGNLSSLATLYLKECSSLVDLPKEVGNLSSLTTLELSACSSLVALPKEVGNLSSLTTFYLNFCFNLVALPEEVGNLFSLITLDLSGCSSLAFLPKQVENLSSLMILNLKGCSSLVSLPKEVGNLFSLTTLNLEDCSSLMSLPKEVGNLSSLTSLNSSFCSSLSTLPKEVENLSSLTTLDLSWCSSLVSLPKEVGNLSSLTTFYLSFCLSLVDLPKEVGNLSSLTTFYLSFCSSLVILPKEMGNLSSLMILNLKGCSSLVSLPKEVGNLSSLTTLNLEDCSSLVSLPKEVGNLSSLTTLYLCFCLSLVALPKEVENLSSLSTLDLSGCSSMVTLPKEVGNLSSLATFYISFCLSLVALPKEVGNLSSLTTLYLEDCSNLATLAEDVGNLSSLINLDLSGCSSLATLPKDVGKLSSLTTLYLSFCSSLVILPKEVGNLFSLSTLHLSFCSSLVALPKEVGNLSSLVTLDLSGCSSLVALPKEVGSLSSLTTLYLSFCSSLVTLPKEVGNLFSLTILHLSFCSSLVALPMEVGNLSSLTTLNLWRCSNLTALPKEVGNLFSLTTLNLEDCPSVAVLLEEVGTLSSLTTLDLSGCSSLVALPKEVGNLFSLTTLNLKDCSSLAVLPNEVGNLLFLTTLDLTGCSSLKALPKEVGKLSSLTALYLRQCSSLMTLLEEVGNLSFLTTLDLSGCSNLAALPKEVGNLSSLATLYLRGCSNLEALPKEVGNLTSLTTLNLKDCSSLVTLPNEVGNLSSLTSLDLGFCSSLLALPKEVGNLSSLTTLDLSFCSSLVVLPKEVGSLSSLNTFNLEDCSSLVDLPKEVGNLSSLTILELWGCSSLTTLPKEVENLSSLTTSNLWRDSSLAISSKGLENMSFVTTFNLEDSSSLVALQKEVENSSSLTTLNSEEYSSQTKRDDEHLLKKQQHETIKTNLKAKFDLSKSLNDTIQEPVLKLLSFLTIKGLHVLSSLLLWIQFYTGMFGQQVLSWNKGKVESKDLITGRFLGQGCSGFIYETIWSQRRTIKLARKDFPGVTSDIFVLEATRLFELRDHQNIVKTFCWTIDNRSCSQVMEYMKDDLSSFMRKKKEALRKKGFQMVIGANPSPFQIHEILDILLQIAIGVEYLHNEGIYHGNLKPNNVLLDWKEGQMLVKVVDFGLLETKRNTTLLSQRAFCFQMIEWSAPELFEDFFSSMNEDLDILWTTSRERLDPSSSSISYFGNGQKIMVEKADSYNFGLISAYVLGGEQMWPAKLSPKELRKQISNYGLRPKLPSKCPKMLASLIYACWDVNPSCRPTFSIIRNKMQEIMKEPWEQLEELGIT